MGVARPIFFYIQSKMVDEIASPLYMVKNNNNFSSLKAKTDLKTASKIQFVILMGRRFFTCFTKKIRI